MSLVFSDGGHTVFSRAITLIKLKGSLTAVKLPILVFWKLGRKAMDNDNQNKENRKKDLRDISELVKMIISSFLARIIALAAAVLLLIFLIIPLIERLIQLIFPDFSWEYLLEALHSIWEMILG